MRSTHYASALAQTLHRRNLWMLIAVLLALANLALAWFVLSRESRERIVIVPPRFEKAFWIQGREVSDSYLEQLGVYVSELALSYSPDNVRYRIQQLLTHTDPRAYAELSKSLQADADRIIRNRISAVFHPQQVRIRNAERKTAVYGLQTRMIGGKISDSRQLALVVAFGGSDRLQVNKITEVEVDAADPFLLADPDPVAE